MKKLCLSSAVILSQIGSIQSLSVGQPEQAFCPTPKISIQSHVSQQYAQNSSLEMSIGSSTGTLMQNRRRRGRKRRYPLKPGPYHDLSSAELQVKTISLLKNAKVGEMTAGQTHECGKLIISWSRRASSSSSTPIQTNHDVEKIDTSLSGKMAERLLRRLVKEKGAGNELAKPSANLYNLVSITHLPLCNYLHTSLFLHTGGLFILIFLSSQQCFGEQRTAIL